MGYSFNPSSSFLTIKAITQSSFSVTTVANTITLDAVILPSYQGVLSYATLDLLIHQIENTNAATNYIISDTYVQIQDTGSTWRNALEFVSNTFKLFGTSVQMGSILFSGTEDIKAYMRSGTSFSVRWVNAQAQLNNLIFYGIMPIINLYFM